MSIRYGREAQIQTFLLTNVIPQSPALNRGLWESLKKIISNDYAERFAQVWMICGPVFASNLGTLKDGKVLIAIFLPVIFMDGIIGKYFYQFGITISAAALLSLIEAVSQSAKAWTASEALATWTAVVGCNFEA